MPIVGARPLLPCEGSKEPCTATSISRTDGSEQYFGGSGGNVAGR